MNTIDRDAIRKRIANCKTYNFGMRDADTLAHEDAAAMLALLDAQPAGWAVDRDALALFLFSRDFGKRNWADVQLGEQQVYTAEADAVIAHLALSAQEAAAEVEWEWVCTGNTYIHYVSTEAETVRHRERGYKIQKRTKAIPAGPWQEAK